MFELERNIGRLFLRNLVGNPFLLHLKIIDNKKRRSTMKENMKKFIEQAELNAKLKAELDELLGGFTKKEEVEQNREEINRRTIEIASKYGFTLTADDLSPKLSEEDLDNVAGGSDTESGCFCFGGGYGGGLGRTGEGWCMCPAVGTGFDKYGSGKQKDAWCVCNIYGQGK